MIIRNLMVISMVMGLLPHPASGAEAAPKPNIIIILVDDMGYADLGCYGGEIRTPNIDALAKNGTRWRSFYNCAQCCPTRASLISGLYPHRAGVGDMIDPHSKTTRDAAASPAYSDRLSPQAVTIAEALKPAGYQTFMTGKWHLGYREGERPCSRGFDRYFGIIAGADSYWKPKSLYRDDKPVPQLPEGFYATDSFTDAAIEYIGQRDETKPFFLYLAYNAPHTPYDHQPADLERYKDTFAKGFDAVREQRFARQKEFGFWPPELKLPPRDSLSKPWEGSAPQIAQSDRMARYASLVDRIDINVGKLKKTLDQQKLTDNTLILFLSDNGAWASPSTYGIEWAETGNTPYRLFKMFVHEGGTCTPFIAHWPGKVPAGVLNKASYGHVKDLLPTCLAVAGTGYPKERSGKPVSPLDGQNLLPSLLDPKVVSASPLAWERRGNSALRDGRWKLSRFYNENRDKAVGEGPPSGKWELYDLQADPFESNDLASNEPAQLKTMIAAYEAWEKQVGVIDRQVIVRKMAVTEKK